jgi:hypothetical protein
MSDIIIGRIKSREVNSFKKEEYVVRVDIPEVNENVIAFPLSHLDEPQIDDEVILFSMNPSLNNVYLYYPIKKFNGSNPFTGFRYNGATFEIHNDGKFTIKNQNSDLLDSVKDLITAIMDLKTMKGDIVSPQSRMKLNKVGSKFNKLLR